MGKDRSERIERLVRQAATMKLGFDLARTLSEDGLDLAIPALVDTDECEEDLLDAVDPNAPALREATDALVVPTKLNQRDVYQATWDNASESVRAIWTEANAFALATRAQRRERVCREAWARAFARMDEKDEREDAVSPEVAAYWKGYERRKREQQQQQQQNQPRRRRSKGLPARQSAAQTDPTPPWRSWGPEVWQAAIDSLLGRQP